MKQPHNVSGKFGSLKWAPSFGVKKTAAFSKAQEYIDQECLRKMDPMTPARTGAMIKSATAGTVIGTGKIIYNSPYARRQYYENEGGSPKHPQGSKLWFERMKAQYGENIRRGAAEYVKGNY